MKSILGAILKGLTGGLIEDLSDKFLRAYERKLAAETDAERLAAEKEIEYLEKRADLQLSELKNGKTWWIRPLFAAPYIIYVWKLIVWDMVLGLGSTPLLPEQLFWAFSGIMAFYFAMRPWEKSKK